MQARLHYLDNLRNIALLVGILFHAFIVYATGIGYTVKARETSEVYTWLALFTHTFRMPLFFLLSGFFSEMIVSKKGKVNYIISRIKRVLVPLIVGLVFLAPVDGYFREINSQRTISFLEYYLTFFLQSSFTFSHIWFLYYLLIFSFLYLNFRKSIISLRIFRNQNFFLNWFFLLFFSIFIPNLFFNKEDFLFQIRPMFFFYYFTFFILGVQIYHYNLIESMFFNYKQYLMLVSLLGILFGIYMYLEEVDQYWMGFLFEKRRIFWRIIHLSIEVSSALGWSLICISLAKKFLNFQTHLTRELTNSLLPVYLIHHPISIILGYILGRSGLLQRDLALVLHIFLVTAISFGFYIVVKQNRLLSLAMGLKFKEKEVIQASQMQSS